VIVAEVALTGLSGGSLDPELVMAVSRVPAVERDLAIVVAESQPAAAVEAVLRARGGDLLRMLRLFDVYRGSPLAADEKSLAGRLVFQAADRTLTESEVDDLVDAIADGLQAEVGGRLRA
jgi:phenylalanyl-tRNA synthetase beta chain